MRIGQCVLDFKLLKWPACAATSARLVNLQNHLVNVVSLRRGRGTIKADGMIAAGVAAIELRRPLRHCKAVIKISLRFVLIPSHPF